MEAIQEMTLEERNQEFLDVEPKADSAIQIRQSRKRSMFRTLIGRGTYALGNGLEKKAYRFFSGLSQQRGLHLWHPVQISRKASAGDPGYDATKYNPHTVNYGFDSVSYGGMGIEHKTPHISIRDLRFGWQIADQLKAVYGFLGDFTNDMWETYNREQYARMCKIAGNQYAVVDGLATAQNFVYDPEAVDDDGDNCAVMTGAGRIPDVGILNWDTMGYFARYLEMQVPMGAITNIDGRPAYGWIGDLEDFDKMIRKDPELREDWRQAKAQALIDGYGATTTYKGFSLMHDMFSPRFALKSKVGNVLTFKRVDPMIASTADISGKRKDVNPAYLNAEFGSYFIFLKDVFTVEIPPSGPSAPGGGTTFGATPGLNGEWKWLNIQTEDNPLNEKGYFFMRAEAFAKPGENHEDPIMVIYRRFVHIDAEDAEVGGTDVASEHGVAVDAVAGDIDAANKTLTVALAGMLSAEADQAITVTDDASATFTGVVADSSNAPVYLLALDTVPAFGDLTAAGSSKVSVG